MEIAKPKRIRRDPQITKKLILDTAERVMVEEGYAAVSSRRIAQEIGLNPATIHYYFAATDDLFIALHERMTDQQLIEMESVLTADNPLLALWNFQSSWSRSALGVEFIALANHRKSIQAVLASKTERARDAHAKRLDRALARVAADANIPPVAMSTILVAIARALANEERVGITRGHKEVRKVVESALSHLTRTR